MALLEALIFLLMLVGAFLLLFYGIFWVRAQFQLLEKQGRVPCPHCAELILPEARICRFCQRALEGTAADSKTPRGLFQ